MKKQDSKIKVNIIIVNYNNVPDTIECLESVIKQDYSNFQIYVVDNSINRDSISSLLSWAEGNYEKEVLTQHPEFVLPLVNKPISHSFVFEEEFKLPEFSNKKVVFIKAKENNGFAAANNVILNYFSSNKKDDEIFWLLNNDTVISKNAVGKIVNFYSKNSPSGIIGTSLMEYYEKKKTQAIGGLYNPITTKLTIPTLSWKFMGSKLTKYPNGASMIVNGNFLNRVGVMDEDYFLYFEELDWILRGKEKGFVPSFLVDTIVYHKGGASTGKNSELADYYYLRGKLLITNKFFRKYRFLVFPIVFLGFNVNRIRKGQFRRLKISFEVFKNVLIKRVKK